MHIMIIYIVINVLMALGGGGYFINFSVAGFNMQKQKDPIGSKIFFCRKRGQLDSVKG